MPFIVVLTLILLGNWLFNGLLIIFPLELLDGLQNFAKICIGILILGIAAWIFGDEEKGGG
ncbi:MAG: hypothetical protein VKL42_03230 [Snowella sp.]|nr:hypothetical protein [Snowella sp.]